MSPPGGGEHPYDRHVGRYGEELARGMAALAQVRAGDRVLDVGCGTGQLARHLASLTGESNMAAIDVNESALEVCRQRIPDGDIRAGSAESLPFEDEEFDAVLAQLVVNLVDDPAKAAEEMVRVARPGGIVAASFWDDREMPLLRSFWDAAGEAAPEELASVNVNGMVGPADTDWARRLWLDAGLRDVELVEFEVGADYESFDDLWSPFEAGIGNSGTLYTSLSPGQQSTLRESAHRRLGSPSGPFRLTAWIRTVRGTR